MKSSRIAFLALAWAGMLIYCTERWIFGPLIPPLIEEFRATRTLLGIVSSASLWGYMFIPIIAGSLSDRFGRKYAVLLGILGFSTLTVLCGLVHTPFHLAIGRFLTGISEGFYFIPLMALTLELFPERPGFFLAVMSSGGSLGWFTGPALAGWLLDLTGTWRAAFIVTGVIGLGVGFLQWWFWPGEVRKKGSPAFFHRGILKPRHLFILLLLSIATTFQISSEFGFTTWYPVFLTTEAGITATAAGLVVGFFGVGQCVGRPILGWLSDRVGYRRLGIAAAAVAGGSLMLTLASASNGARAFFTFQTGFVGAAVMGALWTYTGLAFSSFKGLALGAMITFGYATASLSPIVMGYLGDRYSTGLALWLIAVPTAFLAGLGLLATCALKVKAEEQAASTGQGNAS